MEKHVLLTSEAGGVESGVCLASVKNSRCKQVKSYACMQSHIRRTQGQHLPVVHRQHSHGSCEDWDAQSAPACQP